MARPGSKQNRLSVQVPGPELFLQPRVRAPYGQVLSEYTQHASPAYRKRHGQFFTPEPLAQFMCAWVARNGPSRVLDPAVGLGIFPSVLQQVSPDSVITALDTDPAVLDFARSVHGLEHVKFSAHDFLMFDPDTTWDAIVANPPYLRHHDFSYPHNVFQDIGARVGFRIPETTNLYALFMYEIGRRLAVGGRAAVLVPSDWLSANFGRPLRQYLINQRLLRALVQFAPEAGLFQGALTTSCIVLLERTAAAAGPAPCAEAPDTPDSLRSVRTVFVCAKVRPAQLLEALETEGPTPVSGVTGPDGSMYPAPSQAVTLRVQDLSPAMLRTVRKWDTFLRASPGAPVAAAGSEAAVLPVPAWGVTPVVEHENTVSLRAIARTRRGIATGANGFFLMSRQRVEELGIRGESCVPCVGKAAHVTGLCFTAHDFNALSDARHPVHLLAIAGAPTPAEQDYLLQGEQAGLPARYLLSVRSPWFRMENREPAPIWVSVQGRRGLRFIRNAAGVCNLTAFHGLYPLDTRPVYLDALTVCLNSRAVQQALQHEARVYAEGLVKVQPDDVLDVQIPRLESLSGSALEGLAGLLPDLDRAWRTDRCLPEVLLSAIDQLLGVRGPAMYPVAG